MKFLLFFVSIIFSIIFYIFHNLSLGKDILGNRMYNSVNLSSLSGNLIIESSVFLLIGIIFLYFFSELNTNKKTTIKTSNIEILYFLFYTIFIFLAYFLIDNINYYILAISVFFIISDLLFNHFSNIKKLSEFKLNLRYSGLIINYISSIFSIAYIYFSEFNLILFLILIFNIIFNILVHKKYSNYISLFISIISILFLLYSLYFFLFELYILYI